MVLKAVLLSLIVGLATGLGGGLVALLGELKMRTYDALLGFAVGVMTVIATLGLIQEALTQGNTLVTLAGIAMGVVTLFALDRHGYEHEATFSFVLGFMLLLALSQALG